MRSSRVFVALAGGIVNGKRAGIGDVPLQVQTDCFGVGRRRLIFGARLKPWMGLIAQIWIGGADGRTRKNPVIHDRVEDTDVVLILVDAADRNALAPVTAIKLRAEVVDLGFDPVGRLEYKRGQVARTLVVAIASLPLECARNRYVCRH